MRHHNGNLVEVEDFRVINSISLSRSILWLRVIGFRVLFGLALLVGPVLALSMLCLIDSPDLPETYYSLLYQSRSSLWVCFGIAFGVASISWLLEYVRGNDFKVALRGAGLVCHLPFAYRAFIVVWAWVATGFWFVCLLIYTFVPWVWLMSYCFFERLH